MTTLLIILGVTVLLFISGKFPPDIVALLSMIALYLFGIIDLGEALSGFSNTTVVMIAALFIVGEGLSRTGWTALAGQKFVQWAHNKIPRLLVIITAGSGLLSGFVSNTGTVATLLPVTIGAAWNAGTVPSKLLIPMAFGSNTGGLLTLTGTPPNIIVNDALIEYQGLGFSFFEFALIGAPLLLITILYFRYIGFKLLPTYQTKNRPVNLDDEMVKWMDAYKIEDNYFRLRVRSGSPWINSQLGDWNLKEDHDVSVIRIKRRHPKPLRGVPAFEELPVDDTEIKYHDILMVKGSPESVNRLMLKYRLGLLPIGAMDQELKSNLLSREIGITEFMVTPKSLIAGRMTSLGSFFERFQIQLLAASRNNKPLTDKEIRVRVGDAFLVRGSWENIYELKKQYKHLAICGSPEGLAKNVIQLNYKSYLALGILLLMILMLVLNVFPGAMTTLICAGLMILSGCVPVSVAYKGISWTSVVMIAAMIPMGIALQKTGAAQSAAESLVTTAGELGPLYLMASIFLLTSLFSQTINNSATAVLMAPIALLAALAIDASPEPFLIAVAISASTAFLTPIGTTTNAMVIGAGGYKFVDYLKAGGPLLILFLIASLTLVPLFWPF